MLDKQFDALRLHFNETQLIELTSLITLCIFFNKFNDVMQLDMEDEAVFYKKISVDRMVMIKI